MLVLRLSKELRIRCRKSLHGRAGYGLHGQDQASNHDTLQVVLWAIQRTLKSVEDKAHVFARKMFDPSKAGNVSIGNCNRLGERNLRHLFPPIFRSTKRPSFSRFGQLANQILARAFVIIHSPKAPSHHGFQAVNRGVL